MTRSHDPRRPQRAISLAALGLALILLTAPGISAQEATLQKQLDAQNALIQQQQEALAQQRKQLENQAQQMQEMADRLRRVEDGAAPVSVEPAPDGADQETAASDEGIGSWQGGRGFVIGETPYGSLDLSAYALVRYLNQLPADQDFTDHNGVEHEIDTRNDIYLHRVLIWLRGWMYSEKLKYNLTLWTVNPIHGTGDAVSIIGALGYDFNEKFKLYVGVNGNPGTSTLLGSHPYWLGSDRIMAEEFFRPGFTQGIWATGEIVDRLGYSFMIGNNLSTLGITAGQQTRDLIYSGALWWEPTTGEFGPRAGSGDFEDHQQLATRFGLHFTHGRESRQTSEDVSSPEETQVRLSDSLLFFQTGALAPGVTVDEAQFDLFAANAAIKYKGFWVKGEYFYRRLSEFDTFGGSAPMSDIEDHGFALQTSYMLMPKKLETYLFTSYIFGEFNEPWEVGAGFNYFPYGTRDVRINLHTIFVDHSAASSSFGYYAGGLDGPIISLGAGLMF